jgi:hypothetical protein
MSILNRLNDNDIANSYDGVYDPSSYYMWEVCVAVPEALLLEILEKLPETDDFSDLRLKIERFTDTKLL